PEREHGEDGWSGGRRAPAAGATGDLVAGGGGRRAPNGGVGSACAHLALSRPRPPRRDGARLGARPLVSGPGDEGRPLAGLGPGARTGFTPFWTGARHAARCRRAASGARAGACGEGLRAVGPASRTARVSRR